MSNTTFEEYLVAHGSLTYKNVGVSMLPLLKQGRDVFTVRCVGDGEICRKWDVVLYKRPPDAYVLHRIIRVRDDGKYDILGDNCIGVERGVPQENVIGVMTDFVRKNKPCTVNDRMYKLYVALWCKPYRFRMALKWCVYRIKQVCRVLIPRRRRG